MRGGIAHHTTMLARTLARQHDLTFYSIKGGYPSLLYPGRSSFDTSSKPLRYAKAVPSLSFLSPLSWLGTGLRIARHKPRLLIIPWWVAAWAPHFVTVALLVRAFSRARVLFDCHNVVEHESSLLRRALARIALSCGHCYVVHSAAEAARLRRRFGRKPVFVVGHPPYDFFRAARTGRSAARRALGLSGDLALFFGFVRPYKGINHLLRAMAMLKDLPRLTLVVAGEVWEDRRRLAREVSELGLAERVRLIDRYLSNKEVALCFSAADLVVLPYTSGTGSGVAQVAYSFGLPVVASRIADLKEVVVDGRTGYLVPPGKPRALAAAIRRFFRCRDRSAFRRNIARRGAARSWDNYLELVARVL